MSKRRIETAQRRLEFLERDYEAMLQSELEKCVAERSWGLLGQNDNPMSSYPSLKTFASAASELLAVGDEIESLRAELVMEPFRLHQRYLAYREMRGPNTPGEPKLAQAFLEEFADYADDKGTAK